MDDFADLVLKLAEATRNHEQYRDVDCINLIASEGLKSPAVKEMQSSSSDLEGRYAEGENDLQGHVKKRYYQGQKFMSPIEDFTTDLMKKLFKCDWADVRLVSGTHGVRPAGARQPIDHRRSALGRYEGTYQCPHQVSRGIPPVLPVGAL